MRNSLEILAALLTKGAFDPDVADGRTAASTVYDLRYRVVIVSCAFAILETTEGSGRELRAAKLKLGQFVAMRPWLLTVLRDWSRGQKKTQRDLFPVERLRRGFVGDTVHDNVIEFMDAVRILRRRGSHVVAAEKVQFVRDLHAAVVDEGLFLRERDALAAVGEVKITERMLEGW